MHPSIRHTTITLILLYTVGLLGLTSQHQVQFLTFTPLLLITTATLLLLHQKIWSRSFASFCAIAWSLSFLVEVIGVQTGQVFGTYRYGTNLGWQVGGVPLLIGLNWLILVYAVGTMLAPLQSNSTLKSLVGAALLVVLDKIMEPIALKLGFWHWENDYVPSQNYVVWYLLAGGLLRLFYYANINPQNPIGSVVYVILLAFFGFLGLLL